MGSAEFYLVEHKAMAGMAVAAVVVEPIPQRRIFPVVALLLLKFGKLILVNGKTMNSATNNAVTYDYSNLYKVQNGIATNEPVNFQLIGLPPELLIDLSWIDPSTGFVGIAWWPGEHTYPPITLYQRYQGEVLTVDAARKVVLVLHLVVDWTEQEIANYLLAVRAEIANVIQTRLDQFARTRQYDNIMAACSYANSTVPKFAEEGAYAALIRDQYWSVLITDTVYINAAAVEPFLLALEWPSA